MNKSKKGLGRGLSSLMGEDTNNETILQTSYSDTKIALSKLKPSSIQPRRIFDKNSINELAESIKSKGLVQPILVRPSSNNPDEFEIIAGERRWRAAQIAQLHELPAVVKNLDDSEALEMAIIENVQRADLSPIEEASGYKKLMEQYNHTQEALAPIVGKSRSHISNIIRLLNLPVDLGVLLYLKYGFCFCLQLAQGLLACDYIVPSTFYIQMLLQLATGLLFARFQ